MKKIVHIDFLHHIGEEVQTNIGYCHIKKEWLDSMKNDMYRHKVFLEMHTWYPKTRFDIWIDNVMSGEILNNVVNYSNPGKYVGPIIYTDNTGINVLLDDQNKCIKHDIFVELIENNKVYATFMMRTDKEGTKIIGVDKICLCLGLINNQILFV